MRKKPEGRSGDPLSPVKSKSSRAGQRPLWNTRSKNTTPVTLSGAKSLQQPGAAETLRFAQGETFFVLQRYAAYADRRERVFERRRYFISAPLPSFLTADRSPEPPEGLEGVFDEGAAAHLNARFAAHAGAQGARVGGGADGVLVLFNLRDELAPSLAAMAAGTHPGQGSFDDAVALIGVGFEQQLGALAVLKPRHAALGEFEVSANGASTGAIWQSS